MNRIRRNLQFELVLFAGLTFGAVLFGNGCASGGGGGYTPPPPCSTGLKCLGSTVYEDLAPGPTEDCQVCSACTGCPAGMSGIVRAGIFMTNNHPKNNLLVTVQAEVAQDGQAPWYVVGSPYSFSLPPGKSKVSCKYASNYWCTGGDQKHVTWNRLTVLNVCLEGADCKKNTTDVGPAIAKFDCLQSCQRNEDICIDATNLITTNQRDALVSLSKSLLYDPLPRGFDVSPLFVGTCAPVSSPFVVDVGVPFTFDTPLCESSYSLGAPARFGTGTQVFRTMWFTVPTRVGATLTRPGWAELTFDSNPVRAPEMTVSLFDRTVTPEPDPSTSPNISNDFFTKLYVLRKGDNGFVGSRIIMAGPKFACTEVRLVLE